MATIIIATNTAATGKAMKRLLLGVILLATAGCAVPRAAQSGSPPLRPNCSTSEFAQLDFWVGEWLVFDTAAGYQVGTSRIERLTNACGIRESYDAPKAPGGAYSGTSYSAFDRKDAKWHQMYVDVNGNVTWFTGGMDGRDMVLFAPTQGGGQQRMTYRPTADGSVQQIGVTSTDGGKSWIPGYDYTYRHR